MQLPRHQSKPRRSRALEQERQDLMSALSSTQALIHQAYGGFNTTCDGDLIESYVFEINSLHARYNYLIRRFKELEGAR